MDAPAAAGAAAHEDLATTLPAPLRRLLVDGAPPSTVPTEALRAALRLDDSSAGSGAPGLSLRSLRMLKMLQGLPPEAPTAAVDPPLLTLPGALDARACAALRAAVDASLEGGGGGERGEGAAELAELRDHLLARSFSSSLTLDRDGLERIAGAAAVAALWRLPAAVARAAAAVGAAPAAEEPLGGGRGFEGDVEVIVRRYVPGARPWVPFHYDRAACTVNVALSDDEAHGGGVLLAYTAARGAWAVGRREGDGTAHGPCLLHAVTRVTAGARYSLVLFFGPRRGGAGGGG